MGSWNEASARVVEALLNATWQGMVVALVAGCFLRWLPAREAAARCLVRQGALALLLLLPVMNWTLGGPTAAEHATYRNGSELVKAAPAAHHPNQDRAAAPAITRAETRDPASSGYRHALGQLTGVSRGAIVLRAGALSSLLFALWATLAAAFLLRMVASFARLHECKRLSLELSARWRTKVKEWRAWHAGGRDAAVRVSEEVPSPLLAGLVKPAIVFPLPLLERLEEWDAYNIWLHEMAHLRRRDDWLLLGQKLVESLMFFHPGVKWMARGLPLDREVACDNWVIGQTGAPKPYAACLARLARRGVEDSGVPAALAMAESRHVLRRVEMLMELEQQKSLRAPFGTALAALLVMGVAAAGTAAYTPIVLAQESEAGAALVTEALAVAPGASAWQAAPQQQQPQPQPQAEQTAQSTPQAQQQPQAHQPAPAPNPQPGAAKSRSQRMWSESTQLTAEEREAIRQLREQARKLAESMRPAQEEIRKLSRELRTQMQQSLRPYTEEMRAKAREMAEAHRKEVQPHAREMARLAQQLAQLKQEPGNEAQRQELRSRMAEHEAAFEQLQSRMEQLQKPLEEMQRKFETEFQGKHMAEVEARMAELQKNIDAKMKAMEPKMKELEEKMRQYGERVGRHYRENPPAPPAPPAADVNRPGVPAPPVPPAKGQRVVPPAAAAPPAPPAPPKVPEII
jgi:beta-lactamase regulating signal transducer with metallopeptidase domain